MSIRIANVHSYVRKKGEIAIYVGRSEYYPRHIQCINLSVLGNPHHMKRDGSDREAVITMYDIDITRKIEAGDQNIIKAIRGIIEVDKHHDVALLCFCYPQHCHAHVLLDKCLNAMGLGTQEILSIEAEKALERAEQYGAIDTEVDHHVSGLANEEEQQ